MITPRTKRHIDTLFAPSERPVVEELLAGRRALASPSDLERVHLGALRLCRGDLARLAEILRMDWRDILVGAGFGDDVHAHETWVPRLFTPEVVRAWENGDSIDGVDYRRGERAQIWRGPRAPGDPCVVVSLAGLEPEPRYGVTCDSGETITVPESWLLRGAELP